jgi:Ca2+-binding EF-hand superfamily protein
MSALLSGGAQITSTEFQDIKHEVGGNPGLLAFSRALALAKERNVTPDELTSKLQPFLSKNGTVNTDSLRFIVTSGSEKIATEDADELITLVDPQKKGVVHVDDIVERLLSVDT